MKRTSAITVAMLAAIALLCAGFAAWQYYKAEAEKRQLGLDATRMVAEMFVARGDLRVGQLSGIVTAASAHDGMLFHSSQRTRAPVTVDYMLDLRRIGATDLHWNGDAKSMTVRIPDVTVEPPNVDMTRAQVEQDGLWISRDAGIAMQKLAAQRIELRADDRARSDENLAEARRSALEGVRRLIAQPLAAAGIGGVRVEILFPWQSGASGEQMDRSRSVEDVLANRR